MNRHAERLTGYSEQEMLGKSASVFYDKVEDFQLQGEKRYNADADYTKEHYITPYRHKNGHRWWGDTQGGPVRDKDGNPQYFVAIAVDVTERYRSTQTLNRLHSITSDPKLNFVERMQSLLELGCEHFGLPIGLLTKIEGNSYDVKFARHPQNAINPGEIYDFKNTFCYHVFYANDVQHYHNVSESHLAKEPCYEIYKLEAYIGSPIIVDGKRYGCLNFSSNRARPPFSAQDREIIRLIAQWVGHEISRARTIEELELAKKQLQHAANTDSLTGLPNRRYVNVELERQLSHYERFKEPLSVAIVDFDNFKRLNDRFGHQAGDKALIDFATIATHELRKYDICGRWGGEEFLIVFPNTNLHDASQILERLRTQVMVAPIQHEDQHIPFSISIGLSSCQSGDTVTDITKRADDALYLAKDRGRNRLVVDGDLTKA